MARIGVQAMMLRDEVARNGALATFARAADAGYRVTELSQIPMTEENLAELERARGDAGVEFCSISLSLDGSEDLVKTVSDAKRLGARLVRIGMIPFDALASLDEIIGFARRADEAATFLADHGIELYYHNHHVEFARIGGELLLDIISHASPNVGLELDAHWIARGGMDPARVIEKYAGQVKMVHLKDYRIALPDASAFAARERGDQDAWDRAWNGLVQFAEVGEGNLDWPGIIEQSLASGAEYLLVEQDLLYGRTVWEALETSRRNLVALGYAHLF